MRILGIALVGTCSLIACGGKGRPVNVLLISIDTLRASALGCYGNQQPTSPAIDRLARGGVVFDMALSTAPWTLPAHASLLTGLYPANHSMVEYERSLPSDLDTWARLLKERGFATGAIVNAPFLVPRYRLDSGFDEYRFVRDKERQKGPGHEVDRTKENYSEVVNRSLRWLSQHEDEPFFFFLHHYQVHSDYHALPQYQDQFTTPYRGIADGSTFQLKEVRKGQVSFRKRDLNHLLRLYDAGVRQVDDELNRVFDYLEESGRIDDTLIIVTSDHGEEFLEHGGVLHGRTQFQELLHIPLIFYGPSIPSGLRVSESVSLVDVLPTVLGLLGIPPPSGLDGIDLRPFWSGTPDPNHEDRFIFAGADHLNDEMNILSTVWYGKFKLIHNRLTEKSELYDLETDPGEKQNVIEDHPELAQRLSKELERYSESKIEPAPLSHDLTPEQRQHLVELGYAEESDQPVEERPQ